MKKLFNYHKTSKVNSCKKNNFRIIQKIYKKTKKREYHEQRWKIKAKGLEK